MEQAGSQIVERLDRIAENLKRLVGTVEELAILVATGLTTKAPVRTDSDLPLCEDGACPACGGRRWGSRRGRDAKRSGFALGAGSRGGARLGQVQNGATATMKATSPVRLFARSPSPSWLRP